MSPVGIQNQSISSEYSTRHVLYQLYLLCVHGYNALLVDDNM